MNNSVGRPLKFNTAEELQDKIDDYFEYCDKHDKPYTVSGLAYYLGIDRQTLLNYQEKEEFFGTVKKAKNKIELFVEECLFNKNVPTTGVIFNLKNNYNWKDKQEIESTQTNRVEIINDLPYED